MARAGPRRLGAGRRRTVRLAARRLRPVGSSFTYLNSVYIYHNCVY